MLDISVFSEINGLSLGQLTVLRGYNSGFMGMWLREDHTKDSSQADQQETRSWLHQDD